MKQAWIALRRWLMAADWNGLRLTLFGGSIQELTAQLKQASRKQP